jgi:transposase
MWPEGLKKVKTPDGITHHGIVVCKNCQILWQRDINAGKNMYDIAEAIWNGGQRPSQFARPERQPLQQPHHIAATNAVSSAS